MKTLLLSLAILIAPLTAQADGFTLSCGKIDFGRGLMATQVDGHRIMTTFVVHLLEDKVRAVQEIESQTDQDGFLLSAATRLYSDCAYKER